MLMRYVMDNSPIVFTLACWIIEFFKNICIYIYVALKHLVPICILYFEYFCLHCY